MKRFSSVVLFFFLCLVTFASTGKPSIVIPKESSTEESLHNYGIEILMNRDYKNYFYSSDTLTQDKNRTVTDEETGEPMLTGYTTLEVFNDSVFSVWFNPEYDDYVPDTETLEPVKADLDSVDVTIVMGSWCEDGHREVPRFIKILDYLNYPSEEVTIISVNRDKETDIEGFDKLDVKFVPTIIFYKNGTELGRIVEMPNESLEKDMAEIFRSTD